MALLQPSVVEALHDKSTHAFVRKLYSKYNTVYGREVRYIPTQHNDTVTCLFMLIASFNRMLTST